jgi:DNA mismatch endonuclease (patch repair protein)
MRANRRRDTGPERRVRSVLHHLGLRFRVDFPISDGLPRPVRADIAFTKHRVAVFIDGCFWHGCPQHGRKPGGANDEYWSAKIARNAERDREHATRLSAAGWTVVRAWEHEDLHVVVARVLDVLSPSRQRGCTEAWSATQEARARSSH